MDEVTRTYVLCENLDRHKRIRKVPPTLGTLVPHTWRAYHGMEGFPEALSETPFTHMPILAVRG